MGEDGISDHDHLVRVEERQREVMRRLDKIESKPDELPGLTERMRKVALDAVKPLSDEIDYNRKNQMRLLWVVVVALAGQLLKFIAAFHDNFTGMLK